MPVDRTALHTAPRVEVREAPKRTAPHEAPRVEQKAHRPNVEFHDKGPTAPPLPKPILEGKTGSSLMNATLTEKNFGAFKDSLSGLDAKGLGKVEGQLDAAHDVQSNSWRNSARRVFSRAWNGEYSRRRNTIDANHEAIKQHINELHDQLEPSRSSGTKDNLTSNERRILDEARTTELYETPQAPDPANENYIAVGADVDEASGGASEAEEDRAILDNPNLAQAPEEKAKLTFSRSTERVPEENMAKVKALDAKIESMLESHSAQMAEMETKLADAIREKEAKDPASAKKQAGEIAALKERHASDIAGYEAALASAKKKGDLAEFQRVFKQQEQIYQHQLEDMKERLQGLHSTSVAGIKAEHEREVANIQGSHASEMRAKEEQLTKLQSKMAKLSLENTSANAADQESYAEELGRYQQQVAELRREMATRESNLKATMDAGSLAVTNRAVVALEDAGKDSKQIEEALGFSPGQLKEFKELMKAQELTSGGVATGSEEGEDDS